jgi:hypothetical protein
MAGNVDFASVAVAGMMGRSTAGSADRADRRGAVAELPGRADHGRSRHCRRRGYTRADAARAGFPARRPVIVS